MPKRADRPRPSVVTMTVVAMLATALLTAGCADPLSRPPASASQAAIVVTPASVLETIEASVGQSIVVSGLTIPPERAYVESDDPSVVFPVQPEGTTPAGGIVVGPGTSFVTVWDGFPTGAGDQPLMSFRVAVR